MPILYRCLALSVLILSTQVLYTSAWADDSAAEIDAGKALTFDRKKGNCLACHQIEGGEAAGNIGPPLINMPARFPDQEKLRAQIYDATVANPHSRMPPFGKHGIISAAEVDKIATFIYSLK